MVSGAPAGEAGAPGRTMLPQFSLSGRRAVVTGVNGDMGRAIALGLAAAGADVIGVTRRPGSDEPVRHAVTALGRDYLSMCADLSVRAELDQLSQRLRRCRPSVDILINNAAGIVRSAAVDHTDDDWEATVGVNLTASFTLAREVGRTMLEQGRGKVVFIASMQSFQGGMNLVAYTATKTGVVGIVRALANEWAAFGVNVNAIAPGYIETAMTEQRRSDPDARHAITDRIPAGRWGTPEDVVGAVTFLASPASDYIDGVVLPVDGGWLVR